ncbi:hypothetical protein [Nocardia sp. CA-290969]|uniref:hypothetical protein n=1 Tax=Nocardia sp. CA-290969 TaxID=3239986 RepID=UPI003D90E7BB
MTIAPDYHELHRAVDRLSPEQAEAVYVVVESMLGRRAESPRSSTEPAPARRHRLSFTAAGRGPADLAENAEDYLRASEFGDSRQ